MTDDHVLIETPEHIEVDYELAGLGSRAMAGIVDTLLQLIVTGLIVGGLSWLGTRYDWRAAVGISYAIIIATTGFLAATAYYVVSEMLMDGQSPGKRMAGLRVVRDDGSPITFLDSALRNIIRVVDMLPFFYSVGLLSVFLSKRAKRLGDLAAGTIVVKERLYEQPGEEAVEEETAALQVPPELTARLRTAMHRLGPEDYQSAARFLERRYELDLETRERLGRQIADVLLAQAGLEAEQQYPAEMVVEAVVELQRGRPL